jgi:hypothetical protein
MPALKTYPQERPCRGRNPLLPSITVKIVGYAAQAFIKLGFSTSLMLCVADSIRLRFLGLG